MLEYPQYTRPPIFREMKVPDVLLSGNHEEIKIWRDEKKLERTLARRNDLFFDKNNLASQKSEKYESRKLINAHLEDHYETYPNW